MYLLHYYFQVNGERNPSEVYIDFREAVFKILGLQSGEVREKNVPQSLEAEVCHIFETLIDNLIYKR